MLLCGPFEKFIEASPVSVMMRGIIEYLFHAERIEQLFEEADQVITSTGLGTTRLPACLPRTRD